MDPNAVALIAAGIAALPGLLGLGFSIYTLRQQSGEADRRKAWERQLQDEQRQLLLITAQPALVPTGGWYSGMGGAPNHLSADSGQQRIPLHNEGGSTPSHVEAVLFPSVVYIPGSEGVPPRRLNALAGTYWTGEMLVSAAQNQDSEISLDPVRSPLQGDQSVVPGETLFAPPEPPLGASMSGPAPLYTARLTITFRDRADRKLASIFNLDGLTLKWRHIAGPVEVERDLSELAEQAAQDRKPPTIMRVPRSPLTGTDA